MSEEKDIEQTEEQDDTEVAAKALEAGGDETAAWKLRAERAEAKFKRERDARRGIELSTYRAELVQEFEYADPDLITGKSKQEMRAAAERAHNGVLKIIEKKGLKAAPKTEETPAEKTVRLEAEAEAKRKGDWGGAPPIATEAVSGESAMPWEELQRGALTGKDAAGRPLDRAAVLANIKEHGARRVTRPTIASTAIRARQEPVAK